MKKYEEIFSYKLPDQVPIIIRVDGRSFHTMSKRYKWNKPFDLKFISNMKLITLELCKEIMNVKLAYTQSDEISLLLINYDSLEKESWFDNKIQKICSISASIATSKAYELFGYKLHFDSRCYTLPQHEVINYFIWRQHDWERNSLSMFARSFFSQKELNNKKKTEIHNMLHDIGQNWSKLSNELKCGVSCIKDTSGVWKSITSPIFTKNRNFVNRFTNLKVE